MRPNLAYDHSGDDGDDPIPTLTRMEPETFVEIYQHYYPLLVNIAHKKLNSRAVAEDLVQEVFVSLYQKREYIMFRVSVGSYLSKAIRFKIINEYRSESVRMKYCKNDFSTGICKNDFTYIEMKELSQQIENIYERLPKKCREVFGLSREAGLSQKDISGRLQISVSTVEKHIGKALKIFREGLYEYVSMSPVYSSTES